MLGVGEGGEKSCSGKINRMNIEDLNAVKRLTEPITSEIANLSDRIAQNSAAVSASETATRNQLIEPLLRALGWDTADPDLVTPEYNIGRGRVDYALMRDGAPILLIEAKKHGTKLTADTLLQAFGYVDDKSVEFVAITNGDNWEMHRTPLSNRETVAEFAVTGGSAHATALEAAKLSRDVLNDAISSDTNGRAESNESSGEARSEFEDSGDLQQETKSEKIEPGMPGWFALEQLQYEPRSRHPDAMQLPGGVPITVKSWVGIWREIVEWADKIHGQEGELRFGKRENMAVRDQNSGFWNKPRAEQLPSGRWYQDVDAENAVRFSKLICKHLGVGLEEILFKFDDQT